MSWKIVSGSLKEVRWYPKGEDSDGRMTFGKLASDSTQLRIVNDYGSEVTLSYNGDWKIKWPSPAVPSVGSPKPGPSEIYCSQALFTKTLKSMGLKWKLVDLICDMIGGGS